ncbi:hypothetical protein K438DRAFT_2031313 [Mycena galopus ATCC 62051]|nr:hypothetical protein K438DRAFT_2031313 [Mycena galopus ATCC 62051]
MPGYHATSCQHSLFIFTAFSRRTLPLSITNIDIPDQFNFKRPHLFLWCLSIYHDAHWTRPRPLTADDKLRFSQLGCGPTLPPPFQCVHHAFAFHSANRPDAIAIQDVLDSITFAQLDHQSNCLASRLRVEGVGPGSRICLLVERSISMVVGILGILKAGAAYVPCDGKVVSDKSLEHILKDSESKVVITLEKFSHRLSKLPLTLEVILLDDTPCSCSTGNLCSKPDDRSSPDDSVYVIYTSGTTGIPKGVDVLHRNVTNRETDLQGVARGNANGGYCHRDTIDAGTARSIDYPNIKTVAVAGEACPRAIADSWAEHTQFYNCCGPTEVTIVNTMHLHSSGRTLSIGRPTPNNNVYILDEGMNPTPIGLPGIMWAGGECVTRGYLNLPDKTSERYRLDPSPTTGEVHRSMMFNTGDLGAWRPDGALEHLGRIDDQVKIKGFRVELDGVAVAMETTDGVKAAAALLIDGELWGFVTPDTVSEDEVKMATAKIQPYYAVPTHIVALDSNDKTDKRALRQLALDSKTEERQRAWPANERFVHQFSHHYAYYSGGKTDMPMPPLPVFLVRQSAVNDALNIPVALGDSASSVELKEAAVRELWEGYEKDVLPDKLQGKKARNLRHLVFSLYRRLFGVVFVTNMAILIALMVRGGADAQRLGLITLANLFVAILMRQEYVVNVFFNVFCAVPSSWPLSIRRVCARWHPLRSCDSGTLWLAVLAGKQQKRWSMAATPLTHPWPLSLSHIRSSLPIGIVIFAHPSIRSKRHDSFERVHRFCGWTAIILVWAQVVLLTNDYRGEKSLSHALVHSAPFWMLLVMTGSIILPWLRLRKVPVRAEVLSKHAVRLYFTYSTPITGSFVRLSTHPLKDWHGFATIPVPNEKGFSLVVSKAGDWTNSRITDAPSTIWVRGAPCFGVLRIVPLFRRVVLVATGSGIGPCAPCILEQRVPTRLLWTSPNVRETFGDKLVDEILGASPGAVVYDTRKHGKPDMVKLTLRLVKEFNAEAVCVISNQKLTQKIVYGMMSRGIPAFGAIWDS